MSGLGITGQNSIPQSKGITQEDFLRILSTQLSFQDPLKPIDNQQFLAQMAQFSALEQSRMSNEKMDTLLTFQAASQSVGLIGKTVEVQAASGTSSGEVTTISFSTGQPVLTVKLPSGELLTHISPSQINLVRRSQDA
jgi:flagellar basal-body rod modification protein FlgD